MTVSNNFHAYVAILWRCGPALIISLCLAPFKTLAKKIAAIP